MTSNVVQVDFMFAGRLQKALGQAEARGLATHDLTDVIRDGPPTPLGDPILWYEPSPGEAIFVGPNGAARYESFV